MRIEAYFQRLRDLVDACPVVQSSSITYDKRSTQEGFIRGEIYFVDASVLHLREFVDVETTVERLLYVYQYMDAAAAQKLQTSVTCAWASTRVKPSFAAFLLRLAMSRSRARWA